MDFSERLDLYLQGGMINSDDVADINAILKMFEDEYGVVLTEENADSFIAHLCAAYFRNKTGESVGGLPEDVKNQLLGLDTYKQSLEILDKLISVTHNPLSDVEKDYALLHINNLIERFKQDNLWKN